MNFAANLTSVEQLDQLDARSKEGEGVLIYKHSTRCYISMLAQRRLKHWDQEKAPIYYLDLLKFREVSDEIAKRYKVIHQSPQLLWIVNATCEGHTSHEGVGEEQINSWMSNA